MELLIGLFVVTYWMCTAPAVIADAVATWRASKAGEFDFIDKQRDRKASRQERWGKAWQQVRAARHREAGGDGNYRAGAGAYFGDVYHGFWERGLEKRQAKANARGPYVYDPDAPKWHERVDAAVLDKVDRLRERMPESVRRAGRLLIDPVGEKRPEPQRAENPNSNPDEQPEKGSDMADDTLQEQIDDAWATKNAETSQNYQRRVMDGVDFGGGQAAAVEAGMRRERSKESRDRLVGAAGNNGGANMSAEAAVVAGSAAAAAGAAATEVNTNEDARQAFATMAAAAAEAADAISALEVAKAKMAAAANGTADGMSGKRFDSVATQAATEAADAINVGTLADWSEKVDVVHASAERGLASLNKYIDSEDMVATNNIDPTTLATTH